jgi:threonylcarbamoyladenosine tRNA methylthiotransferase MtaB
MDRESILDFRFWIERRISVASNMRVAITTLGCKINQYDSAVIRERLGTERYSFVPFEDEADFYIINTCTVTDRADWEARQLIRRAKRRNPQSKMLLTGCYAQVSPEEVGKLPGVDFVVGLNRLDELVRFVQSAGDEDRKIAVGDVRAERGVSVLGARGLPGRTRAFLKVQEGCNFACTFCIIPMARGRSRSVPPDEVLRQVAALAAEGIREIVLTGIHLGSYGHDLRPRIDLTGLLQEICAAGLVPRLRLSSLDPREVPDRLLELIAGSEIVCDHLHVCLQAGGDQVLKAMRRNYDAAYYRDLLARAREILPDAALGSDLIVGFPGETNGQFSKTIELLEALPLTYCHVFPYSVRKGTPAAAMPLQVAPQVKKERARLARELMATKRREFYGRFIGKRVRVLVEGGGSRGRVFKGYSRNYLPVSLVAGEADVNREVDVLIEAAQANGLRGYKMNSGTLTDRAASIAAAGPGG